MRLKTWVLSLVVTAATAADAQTERSMTVDDLFQLLESNSKTLLREKISVEFAQKKVEAARTARLPELSVSASATMYGDVLVTDRNLRNVHGFATPRWGNSLALEAQQVVYAGGAVNAGIHLAELEREQADVGEEQTRQQQRLLALGQYLDILRVKNSERVVAENIGLTERLIEEIRAHYDQGLVLENDVTRYELQLQSLTLEHRRLQDQRTILNHQLCNLLGIDDVSIVPQMPTEPDAGESLADWGGRAVTSAPSMRRAELAQQMATEQVKMARSELRPKVALVAVDNFSGPFTYDIPPIDKNINFWYVGIGVKYSLSSLFKQRKHVEQAQIGVLQAEESRQVAWEQTDNAIQQAWTLWQQAYVELATRRKSVELACQNYQVVSDRYLSQLALITDMVDASNVKLGAELDEVNARIAIAFAYYRLKFAAGVL